MFWTRNPAMIPMVVGREAAQTPSFFSVFSSILEATTRGGAQPKQAVSPGTRNCDTLLGAAIVNKEIKAPDSQLCYAVVH